MGNSPDDGELLTRFARAGEEAPFQELLRRHGKMVLQVCHRILLNSADAEDAAQAVFLTLAQRAKDYSLQHSVSLGGWLHTLAWRVAKRQRAAGGARKRHEQEAAAMSPSESKYSESDELMWEKFRPLLDELLADLPEKYRLTIILCDLEGRSQGEAADLMATPRRTVSERLTRARELLRHRLQKHGIVLSVALCASLLSAHSGAGEAPAAFIASTSKAASLAFQGKLIPGITVSGSIALLMQQATKVLPWSRLQIAAVIVILLSLASVFGYWYLRNGNQLSAGPAPATAPAQPNETVAPVVNPSPQLPVAIPNQEPVPPVVAEKTPAAPVDLLMLIDPQRDTVAGTWTRTDDGIISDVAPRARLQVPYGVPEEYDLTMVFSRASGAGEVAIVLKKNSAQQFRWVMGGWDNEVAGFDTIRGKYPRENPSGNVIRSGVLKNDLEYTTLVQVRNTGVRAYLQGDLISEHKTDYGDMRLWDLFSLPDARALGIISQNGTLIVYAFTLTPVTGSGGVINDVQVAPTAIQPLKIKEKF